MYSKNPDHLTHLSKDPDYLVRDEVVHNKHVPSEGLNNLMHDSNMRIRSGMALLHQSSHDILVNDPDPLVRLNVIRSIHVKRKHLDFLANNDPSNTLRYAASTKLARVFGYD